MEDFSIRGFYGKKMAQYLQEDVAIKEFLEKTLKDASVASIQIEHSANRLQVIIESARPGIIIGRGGQGLEQLKKMLSDKFGKKHPEKNDAKQELKIDIKEIKNPWINAALVGQFVAQQIERRIPFRQVLKKGIERVMQNKEVKGVRMEVSGRLNGNEIARKEWLRQGRLPRQTIRADIDYALTEAHCTYGTIGVKIWIYKGDKFE